MRLFRTRKMYFRVIHVLFATVVCTKIASRNMNCVAHGGNVSQVTQAYEKYFQSRLN